MGQWTMVRDGFFQTSAHLPTRNSFKLSLLHHISYTPLFGKLIASAHKFAQKRAVLSV